MLTRGPAILFANSIWQRKRYLIKMILGGVVWCPWVALVFLTLYLSRTVLQALRFNLRVWHVSCQVLYRVQISFVLVSDGFPMLRNLYFHLPDSGEIVDFLNGIEIEGQSLVHQHLLRNSYKQPAFAAPYCKTSLQPSQLTKFSIWLIWKNKTLTDRRNLAGKLCTCFRVSISSKVVFCWDQSFQRQMV